MNVKDNKMKKQLILATILSATLATGCKMSSIADVGAYETGTKVTQEQMSQLTDNISTADDVEKLIGYPTKKEQVGKKEIWYFDYTKIPHFGSNISETSVFEFNSKGILAKHYKAEKAPENPLLQ